MTDPNPFESPTTTEKPKPDGKPQTPPWAWGFFAACLAIMVLTRGGAIWGALGGGVGGLCVKISQMEEMPLVARTSICTAITAALWAGILVLVKNAGG